MTDDAIIETERIIQGFRPKVSSNLFFFFFFLIKHHEVRKKLLKKCITKKLRIYFI